MARLPVPGGDDGAWGTLLNDYLLVEHNPDGTHKGGRLASLLVAASDAPAGIQAAAHYVCNGTDDQAEINQAIAYLGTVGGQIQLSPGTFNCGGAIRLNRRVMLVGAGRATILKAIGSWTAFDGTSSGAVIEPVDAGIDKTAIASLAINGNRWSGGDVKGIYYNITTDANFDEGPDAAHYFSDIYIYHTRQHGFHIAGERMRGNNISRLRVYNVGEEGVTEAHGFYVDCPDSFFSQCESGSSSGSGFYAKGGNLHFTNCKSWYSDLSGWQIRTVRGQYAACEAQDNEQHGFYITAGPNSLTSCHADSNGWLPPNGHPSPMYDGFHIPWGNHIQLIGCSAYDKDEGGRGNWQQYGYFLGSSSDHCQIIGTAKDNATAISSGSGIGKATNFIQING